MRAETVADRLERFCAEAGHGKLAIDLLRATDQEALRSIEMMTETPCLKGRKARGACQVGRRGSFTSH